MMGQTDSLRRQRSDIEPQGSGLRRAMHPSEEPSTTTSHDSTA